MTAPMATPILEEPEEPKEELNNEPAEEPIEPTCPFKADVTLDEKPFIVGAIVTYAVPTLAIIPQFLKVG